MSQPSKESVSPPAARKSGCGGLIVKSLVVLVVLLAGAGLAYYLRMQYLDRIAHEETIRKELEQPQSLVLKAVQDHDEAKAALGEPVADAGKLQRHGTGELDRSNAAFSFDVAGQKDKGRVDAVAKQADGNWQISQIKVKLSGGKTIDVPPPSADAPPEIDFGP